MRRSAPLACTLALAALVPTHVQAGEGEVFTAVACPSSIAVAECFEMRDARGAWVLAAMPQAWNTRLIVHAHGGPRLGEPKAGDGAEDLDRYAAMVAAGYAWVGSSYRRGGYGVRMAAEDTEHARRLFIDRWGSPQRVLLHGQSWGGNVAAKAAELYGLDVEGRPNYHAVLTTNGLLTGGTRAYGFRADLRAIYQFYCGNHPAPDEPQYPLWQGLPAQSTMTREAVQARVDDCTGIARAADARSPEQAARLADILNVSGVAEAQLVAHLAWGTFHFRDLVQRRLGGRNPFDNSTTVYRGSRDDPALNAGIERFSADPQALAQLGYDADLSGLIALPTLNVHARHDPVVASTSLAAYAATVNGAGRGHLLAQALTDESDHSRLRDATYLTVLAVLEHWLDDGERPAAEAFQARCLALGHAGEDCRFK